MLTAVCGALLSILLVTAVYCAQADIRRGVVPNHMLLGSAALAAALQAVYCTLLAPADAPMWLLSMALSDVLAVLMYASGLWAAGDAKLFMVLYLCVPGLMLDGLGLSASVIPYLYIFMPAMLWIAADTLWQALHHAERYGSAGFDLRQLGQMAAVALETAALQALLGGLVPAFFAENELFCAALSLVYAVFCSQQPVMKKPVSVLLHAAGLLAAMLLGGWRSGLAPAWVYAVVLLVLLFGRWAAQYNYRRLPTQRVQAGMILSSVTVLRFASSRVQGLPQDASEGMSARLTEGEAEAVRRWEMSAKGQDTVVIVRKIPFAILIGLGFALRMAVRLRG